MAEELSLSDLKVGTTIGIKGDPWIITAAEFMKKSKTRPVVRTTIRNLRTGQVQEQTFQQGDIIKAAEVEKVKAQYLFRNQSAATFMQADTFEQHSIPLTNIEHALPWLREGQEVTLIVHEGNPVSVELPPHIEVKVTSAPPGVRGDSATNVMKEIVIDTGAKIKAPLFIKEGDTILVDTRTGKYVERANK
jgi:elongation factor P